MEVISCLKFVIYMIFIILNAVIDSSGLFKKDRIIFWRKASHPSQQETQVNAVGYFS